MSLPNAKHLITGRKGELIAIRYLREKGYEIINQNVTFGREEIDIVAKDGDTLVFVEVKSRKEGDSFLPSQKVDKKKLSTIRRLSQIWLDRRSETLKEDLPARIDVIGVCEDEVMEHYEDVTG